MRLLPLYGSDPEAFEDYDADAGFGDYAGLTAAIWNATLHPRDHHGRFISVGDFVHILFGGEEKSGRVTGIEDGKVAVDTDQGTVRVRPDQIRDSIDVRATLGKPSQQALRMDFQQGPGVIEAVDRKTGDPLGRLNYNEADNFVAIDSFDRLSDQNVTADLYKQLVDQAGDKPVYLKNYAPGAQFGISAEIASDYEFRMGSDGKAHITHPGKATALDGTQTIGPAPADGKAVPCERCLGIAAEQIADKEAGIVPEQPLALQQLAEFAKMQAGQKSAMGVSDWYNKLTQPKSDTDVWEQGWREADDALSDADWNTMLDFDEHATEWNARSRGGDIDPGLARVAKLASNTRLPSQLSTYLTVDENVGVDVFGPLDEGTPVQFGKGVLRTHVDRKVEDHTGSVMEFVTDVGLPFPDQDNERHEFLIGPDVVMSYGGTRIDHGVRVYTINVENRNARRPMPLHPHKSWDGSWKSVSPQSSLAQYSGDPKRKAENDAIIAKMLDGHVAQENPKWVYVAGGPGSGKSTLKKRGVLGLPDDYVSVDPDWVKSQWPDYMAKAAAGDDKAAGFYHAESSEVARAGRAEALDEHMNIVADGIGNGFYRMREKVDMAHRRGYTVEAHYVTCSTDEALRRNDERFKKTGRKVAPSLVADRHRDVTRTVVEAIQTGLFDYLDVWDTNNTEPEMIARMQDGKLEVLNPVKFTAFVQKGDYKELPDLNLRRHKPAQAVGIPVADALAAEPGDEFVMLGSNQPATLSKPFVTVGGLSMGVVMLADGTEEYVRPDQLGQMPPAQSVEAATGSPVVPTPLV